MHELDAGLRDGEQSSFAQLTQCALVDKRGCHVAGQRAACPQPALARCEPDQQTPGPCLRVLAQAQVGVLGAGLERPAHAAAGPVSLDRQPTAVPIRPRPRERRGDERKRARVTTHIVEDGVEQCRLELEADPPSRLSDHLAQLVVVQRRDKQGAGADSMGEPREFGQAAVVVRADHQHDPGASRHRGRELRVGLHGAQHGTREGEQLLGLVEDEQVQRAEMHAGQVLWTRDGAPPGRGAG
jgi:hypothetical protein